MTKMNTLEMTLGMFLIGKILNKTKLYLNKEALKIRLVYLLS